MIVLTLTFFPSFSLTEVTFTRLSHISKNISSLPGELIVQTFPIEAFNIQVNDQALSKTSKPNSYFFVVGIYRGARQLLHGELRQSLSWYQKIFLNPTQKIFRHFIDIQLPPLKSGNKLRLPSSVVSKLQAVEKRKKAIDRNRLKTALQFQTKTPISCWQIPVNSKITSPFAKPRTLPSGRSYYHSGVDLRAWTNTPIANTGGGTVVFAGHMSVPGNNVIVSHGSGVHSRYLHLEKVLVKTGDRIPAGQIIGLAGATGRVEAPHLHWEVIWKGNHASPLLFLERWEQICDPK